jgi:tRNA(Ile)-lysidine synthase TilS/MesJ
MMHINVDHLVVTPSFETLKKMVNLSASNNLYSMKALERASSICTTCISIVRFLGFKIAIEKEIPFVVLGMSPGQAPVATSVFKTNAEILRKMQDAIFQPLFKYLGDIIRPYFLDEKHFKKHDSFPFSINPLAFLNYDEEEIYKYCMKLGWQPPMDTDPNSTNCLMNAFANQNHIDQFGFHPYAFEIAGLVRMGVLSREEGLKRLNEPGNKQIIEDVKQKLGITSSLKTHNLAPRTQELGL